MGLKPSAKRIYLSSPHMGGREIAYVNEAFATNWIAPLGPNVDQFEAVLSKCLEDRPVVALSSGTAALHLGLIQLGVGPGDRVLCQSFSFSASANPIRYLGAEPVFIGSETRTWNASSEHFERAIKSEIKNGRKPKAFIPVHLYGAPAEMGSLGAIADRYEIPVLEDAAESLGSTLGGRPTGAFGQYGVLSFNGNKIVTTSGGGALVCPSRDAAERVKFLSTQARDPAPYYLHSSIGYNYRLSNVLAGIGLGQMEVLDDRVSRRRAIFDRYRARLESYGEFEFRESQKGSFENRWLSTVTFSPAFSKKVDLLGLIEKMNAFNVECRPLWKPLHTQPIFKSHEYFGDDVETDLFGRGLCLPSASSMTEADQDFVIDVLLQETGLK